MSYYQGPMSYFQSPVRWDQDEKQAPVPGWGMWLSDVTHRPQIIGANGYGDATTDPAAPPPVATASAGLSSSMGYVFGGLLAGAVLGYLIGKGH